MASSTWRGLVYDATEGVRELLAREQVTGYIGFDPDRGEPARRASCCRSWRSRACSGSATRRSRSSAAAPG